MDHSLKQALAHRLLALADDELVLAHRDSEWTGHAPLLEEDIALANIAQDELGHAMLYYELLARLTGQDPDQLVFFREVHEYRNVQLVELPKGDWALTMTRQFLFDAYECSYLDGLQASGYGPLAEATSKMRREEIYHLRHSQVWVERLGLGTSESKHRMQRAVNMLWAYALQLFVPLPDEAPLVVEGFFPALSGVRDAWEERVRGHLEVSGLEVPERQVACSMDRSQHSRHMVELLAALQLVARSEKGAEW